MRMRRINYTDLEYEIIGLKATIDTIDSMVNREMLQIYGPSDKTEALFPDDIHQKLFYILLSDFLSKNTEHSLMRDRASCMDQLQGVVRNPSFKADSTVMSLSKACKTFSAWLDKEIDTKIWAPSLEVELAFHLSRREIIYFSANMSKHHFGHLTNIINRINKQLRDQERPQHDLIPALENIYSELYTNILNYHGSTVAEMLNNIRWGIHEYLLPEFTKSYRKVDDMLYEFSVPQDIKTDFARSCYWALMNSVRSRPYIDTFKTNEILKLRY